MDIDWRVKVEELNLAKRWDAAFGESPRKHWTAGEQISRDVQVGNDMF